MGTLSENWITEKHIDFEYKKYILLAYLSEVNNNFEVNRLYPCLADLIEHYKQLSSIKENKLNILNSFPKRLKNVDVENVQVNYEKLIEDDKMMEEIETIVNYSIPKFEYYLNEGKKIYDFIEEQLHISPVGLIPLYPNEGYILLNNCGHREVQVYEYQITLFEQPNVKYRGIHTAYLTSYSKNISNTAESIKSDLTKNYKKYPNPATYMIESEISIPLEETFLPIAKRTLVKYLASNEQ